MFGLFWRLTFGSFISTIDGNEIHIEGRSLLFSQIWIQFKNRSYEPPNEPPNYSKLLQITFGSVV